MKFITRFIFIFILANSFAYADSSNIAAAADLRYALEKILNNFEKNNSGEKIKLIFGSSGLLTQQAMHKAPFDMIMSADEQYIDMLSKANLTIDNGKLYAVGRIVLLQKKGGEIELAADKVGLLKAIKQAKKIAIANPDHAPYGRAAKEYLQKLDVWEAIGPKLVYGENISQTTSYAMTGSVDFAISALSLASSPQIRSASNYLLIPDSLHNPLRQKMALLRNASPAARDFYRYIQEPEARSVMAEYGFTLPN